jgi:hypothetical protein
MDVFIALKKLIQIKKYIILEFLIDLLKNVFYSKNNLYLYTILK